MSSSQRILYFRCLGKPICTLISASRTQLTLEMHRCDEEFTTEEELSALLQKKINMTLKEAVRPVLDYNNHPVVKALRKKFADEFISNMGNMSKMGMFGGDMDDLEQALLQEKERSVLWLCACVSACICE